MLLSWLSLAYAGPSWTESDVRTALVRVTADAEVRDAVAASVLAQADRRPIGALGGGLAFAVDLGAVLDDPLVDRAVSDTLGVDVTADLAADLEGRLGLLVLPPQLAREVGAYWDDGLVDLAEATEFDQRTDDVATAIVVGGAILLWGLVVDTVHDTLYPPPPPPPPEQDKPADQPSSVDTTPNGCASAQDCDNDGVSNYYDQDDDGDGVPDLAPDQHPYDSTQDICDLCGNTSYPVRSFVFFLGREEGYAAESFVTATVLAASRAPAVPLGGIGDQAFTLFAD